MSLRDKQIREILDSDLKSYNEVLKREFQQARLMNESYAPPNRLERRVAFDIDKYFIDLTKSLDGLITEYTNSNQINNDQVLTLLSTYDTLIAFLNRYASTHPLDQRDLSTLEDKFDALLPNLEKMSQIADEEHSPMAKRLNALYNLIESRDYISLKGNTEEVSGRKHMLVDRREEPENPHYDPYTYERDTSVDYRPKQDVYRDEQDQDEVEVEEFKPRRKEWDLPERRGRERLTKDNLKDYIDTLDYGQLDYAFSVLPHVREGVLNQQNNKTFKARIKSNEAYMRDIYSLFEEAIMATEHVPTPRGRSRTQQLREQSMREASLSLPRQNLSPFNERDAREIFPEIYGEEMEGDGVPLIKTKKGRFQIRGKGEAEDKMFGLPYGFKRAMELRPIDRKPMVHYNGQNFDLTLEERMEFLNQLDSHKVSDEEWKLNSVRNLSEMKEHKYKKRK